MKIYYYQITNPRKVCAVAKYLDLPVDYVLVDLTKGEQKQPDYLAINPNGKVPALIDGDVRLWESNAIMMYLAQQAGSELWPSQNQLQVEVMMWLSWNAAHFSRYGAVLVFETVVKQQYGLGEPDQTAIDEAKPLFNQYAEVLDQHLADREFVVGEQLTIADFALATNLSFPGQASIPTVSVADYPNVAAWNKMMTSIPAWDDPWPD